MENYFKIQLFLYILLMSAIIVLCSDSVAYCGDDRMVKLEVKILSLAKENSPKLYDALDEIDKLPIDEAISLYVGLIDYYIGEHGTEIHLERATKIGEKIIPFLIEKRNMPLMCLEQYKSLCVKDIEERNRKIGWIIDAIKKGIVLYAEYPESLKLEVETNVKIVKIFLEDYKKSKGKLPKDLHILKEYVWKEYGYKLKIFNPWGQPLKYLSQKGNKYILEPGSDMP